MFILLPGTETLRTSPYAPPRNYPPLGVSPPSGAGADSPPPPQETFPVIHVQFSFPPTMIDARRRLALADRQKEIIGSATAVSELMDDDVAVLMEHIEKQTKIIQYMLKLPSDPYSPLQSQLLNALAAQLPEVPVMPPSSSFLEENPQVNIGIEDNVGGFKDGPEMSPRDGVERIGDIANAFLEDKSLLIALLKINFKKLEIVFDFLKHHYSPIVRQPFSLLQAGETGSTQPAAGALAATGNPGNATAPPAPKQGSARQTSKIGVDYPLYMALRARVMEGGRNGAKALAALIDLWNERPGAREGIRKSMVAADCRLLMMSPKTPDYIKNLAGSLITLMSGLPVSASVPDSRSGSYGHVNIVVPRPRRVYLPDKEVAFSTGGD